MSATPTNSTVVIDHMTAFAPADRITRTAGWVGVVAAATFPVLVIAASAQFDGYSHVSQKISELAGVEATRPLLQTINFVLLGTGALAVSLAMSRTRCSRIGAALVGAFGVMSGWLGAAFPCDAGCVGETPMGLAHNAFGALGFVSVAAAMFVSQRAWARRTGPRRLVRATRAIRPLTVVTLVWFIATQALDKQSVAGVVQRVLAASILAWLGLVGWALTHPTEAARADRDAL